MGLFARGRKAKNKEDVLTLFYASDLHGAERSWRKFLGAASYYSADAIVLGGDLVAKAIVPIAVDGDGSFSAEFLGEPVSGRQDELDGLLELIRFNGMYPWLGSQADIVRYREDEEARDALFEEVMVSELGRWVALGDSRLADSSAGAYIMAGNDDPWCCDPVIEAAHVMHPCDGRIVKLGEHEMLSSSLSNPTPWNSPRELEEDQLYERLHVAAEALEDPSRAIFNLHVPPHGTGLDTANQLDENLQTVYRGGRPVPIAAGSIAVMRIIQEYQPMLALHGHIHESRGKAIIGRTVALNAGSDYASGRLMGVVVRLSSEKVLSHQFVTG